MTPEERTRIELAIKLWFDVKDAQGEKSRAGGKAQGGNRSTVTGGAHLKGVNQLIVDEIEAIGTDGLERRTDRQAELPGYFRRSKQWDLLVLQHGSPILAVEYKSMTGSVARNSNNRIDEVIGVAEDARQAAIHDLLPVNMRRAYIYLLEATPEAIRPSPNRRPSGNPDILFFNPDHIFNNTSYLDRLAITAKRMREENLYHMVWVVAAIRNPPGFMEPSAEVGWDQFVKDLRDGFDWHGNAKRAPDMPPEI